MSERKVLNKYYPPDFDPSKIPRMKLARNRQYTVRLMAPFNMRCKTCGEYIYKGKKFNARKEDVEGDDYLGIRIYRFYIKCTRCLQEISFKTDPKNTDYEIEAGATRNFMALKLAEEQAQREEDEEKEEEATNPMKLLEKRTQQSKQELELLESLEELKDLNRRQQIIDYDRMLAQYDNVAAQQRAIDEQEKFDEAYIKSIFRIKPTTVGTVVEEEIVELPNLGTSQPPRKILKTSDNARTSDESADIHRAASSDGIDATEYKTTVTKQRNLRTGNSSRSPMEPPLRTTLGNWIKKKTILGVRPACPADGEKCVIDPSPITAINESVDNDFIDTKITDTSKNSVSSREGTKTNSLSLLCSYSSGSDNESN